MSTYLWILYICFIIIRGNPFLKNVNFSLIWLSSNHLAQLHFHLRTESTICQKRWIIYLSQWKNFHMSWFKYMCQTPWQTYTCSVTNRRNCYPQMFTMVTSERKYTSVTWGSWTLMVWRTCSSKDATANQSCLTISRTCVNVLCCNEELEQIMYSCVNVSAIDTASWIYL